MVVNHRRTQLDRIDTFNEILKDGEWLTAEALNQLFQGSSFDIAGEWKASGRIFSVALRGEEYFPLYQFDALYQPLAIISKVLANFGSAADTWKIAAWFHYPNGWIVDSGPQGVSAVAPKDALNRPGYVLKALERLTGSYSA